MATKVSTNAVVRNAFIAPTSQHLKACKPHSWFPPSRRRTLLQRPRRVSPASATKSFTTSCLRKFADVDDSFDPRQQDRESDEVDVCIVGGGMLRFHGVPHFDVDGTQVPLDSALQFESSSWPRRQVTKIFEWSYSKKLASWVTT